MLRRTVSRAPTAGRTLTQWIDTGVAPLIGLGYPTRVSAHWTPPDVADQLIDTSGLAAQDTEAGPSPRDLSCSAYRPASRSSTGDPCPRHRRSPRGCVAKRSGSCTVCRRPGARRRSPHGTQQQRQCLGFEPRRTRPYGDMNFAALYTIAHMRELAEQRYRPFWIQARCDRPATSPVSVDKRSRARVVSQRAPRR